MAAAVDTRELRDFARETKFLVAARDAARLKSWARTHLSVDPHGSGPFGDEYTTTTLYFETAGFDVYFRRGSFGRSKFRIRRYGNSDAVFLERKLRTEGLLAKRRSVLQHDELDRLEAGPARGWSGHWFHKRLVKRALAPSCQLSYRRMARVGSTELGPIRLTIDDDLRVTPASRIAIGAPGGHPVLNDQVILELKYRTEMPALFRLLLEEFGLVPQSVSKYRFGVATLGEAPCRHDLGSDTSS